MGYEEREHWCRREDENIYGKLFLPGGGRKMAAHAPPRSSRMG